MDDIYMRMLELSGEGFFCSQILMQLILEIEGKENKDLIRAMGGLAGGLGNSGNNCGALTGGVCIIGYFCSKGEVNDIEDSNKDYMIKEFIDWFRSEGSKNKGINCDEILSKDPSNKLSICPYLVRETFDKILEILNTNGYEI